MKFMLATLLTFTLIITAIPSITLATDPPQPPQSPQTKHPPLQNPVLPEDFSITASLKIWSTTIEFSDDIETSSYIVGPSINLTFQEKYYAGLNYYTGDGFDYEGEEQYGIDESDGDYSKTDFDLWAGYRFHPKGSAFLGYKHSKLKDEATVETTSGITAEAEKEIILKGPVIGINGNYPISNTNLILFGTIAYGFLSVDIDAHLEVSNSLESYSDSADSKQDYDGYAMEFGASYYFENFPKLSLTAGYKYQKYTNTDDSDDYISFRGLTFGANYRF